MRISDWSSDVCSSDLGIDLPREFMHMEDPLICLSAMAAVTERLLLGTGTCLITMRDPIILAKEVATIDQNSDGRALFVLGTGWNRSEERRVGNECVSRCISRWSS